MSLAHIEKMEGVVLWNFQKNVVQPQINQEDACSYIEGCCSFYCKYNSGSVMIMRGSGGLPALVFVAV